MIITTTSRKNQKNGSSKRKRELSFEDIDYSDEDLNDDALIEPVSYEANQELLRAFGQPVGTSSAQVGHNNNPEGQNAPREPTYCFCNSVSYGDMIACDNKNCPYEWFHFPCVGLVAKPEGKWFCQKCLQNQHGQPVAEGNSG
jgi:hypothetical protein